MKKRLTVPLAALACAAALLSGRAAGEDPKPPGPDAMKRWMDACTPGAAHRKLERLIGRYDTVTRMTMGPGKSEEKGTAEFRWLHPGRWVQSESEGTMMGHPMRGTGTWGYDNFKGKYVLSFVDSFQTCMNTGLGLFNRDETELVFYGTIDEPLTPEQDKPVKYVLRFVDANSFVFEVHDLAIGGADTKVLETIYTRKP
jgi:hypothetical protein